MRPSRRPCFYASLALLASLAFTPRTNAETLTITSTPSGATVEIDGVVVGTTPCQVKYPGGYFHKTKTVLGERLEHALALRVYKDGYAAQDVQLTEGPFEWVNLKGKNYGHYWLLKTNKFAASLQPLSRPSTTSTNATGIATTSTTAGRDAKPANTTAPLTTAALAPAPSSSGDGSIDIVSDRAGADIYVDGRFVGQTPSVIHLPSGAHRIEVRSPGIPTWERDLEVLKDSQVSLHASLNQHP
jgi:serine protease Do